MTLAIGTSFPPSYRHRSNPERKAGCRRLLQWTPLVIPSSTIIFLSPLTNNKTETSTPITSTHPRIPDRLAISLGSPPFMEETKRLSSSSTSTVTSSDSSQLSSILVTKPNADKPKGRVTFADEIISLILTLFELLKKKALFASFYSFEQSVALIEIPPNTLKRQLVRNRLYDRLCIMKDCKICPNGRDGDCTSDELESVVSDRESLYQDYAYLDDAVPGRSNTGVDYTVNNDINDEDRQLARFYAPKLDQHMDSLSLAVEGFLGTVENNLPQGTLFKKES
ncbi:hypothetical protein KIN20_021267, partial [Parelaphostrongylus tenuis]